MIRAANEKSIFMIQKRHTDEAIARGKNHCNLDATKLPTVIIHLYLYSDAKCVYSVENFICNFVCLFVSAKVNSLARRAVHSF